MFPSLVVTVGLLMQAVGNPQPVAATRAPRPEPVRVWRTDSVAYVQLVQPGHLVVLQVDAIGRIAVLFPSAPWDSTAVSAGAPVAIDLVPEAQGNPATFLALRSRWRFDFETLQSGIEWNYDALLLQPTAGDQLAALFDIADRITHGRPYDYGVVTYARDGPRTGTDARCVPGLRAPRSSRRRSGCGGRELGGLFECVPDERVLWGQQRQRIVYDRALRTAASDLPTSAGHIHVLSAVPRSVLQSVAVTIRPADSDDASGRAERVFYRAAGGRSVAWNAGPASLSDKRETQNGTRCVCRVPFCVMSGGAGN